MLGSAQVSSQVASHAGGFLGADQWGLLAIVLGVVACVCLGLGLRMLFKSKNHSVHRNPPLPGRKPRSGARGQ